MFVDAPVDGPTSFATWYAGIWLQEPVTLQAFVSLFGIRRFFLDADQQLPALLDRSLTYQDDVTDALGEQVTRAVEVLVQAFDRADIDRNRQLLDGIDPSELYEAGLTVMMRVVFLLSAEERALLLLGDQLYEANYAVSTLRMQLRSETEEIWSDAAMHGRVCSLCSARSTQGSTMKRCACPHLVARSLTQIVSPFSKAGRKTLPGR